MQFLIRRYFRIKSSLFYSEFKKIIQKEVSHDIYVIHLLTEKYSHDLIQSMVNLIQFSKETSTLNVEL